MSYALLAGCSGAGSSLPTMGKAGALAPQIVGTCVPRVGYPCPTPKPTPTPYNGPVGPGFDLSPSASNPALLHSATLHVMYVDYETSMGNQVQFLKDLSGSSFFTYILNQYVSNLGTFAVDPTPIQLNVPLQNGYLTENISVPPTGCPPGYVPMDGNICQIELPIVYYDQDQIMQAASSHIKAGKASDIWHIIVPGDNYNSLCRNQGGQLACWVPGSGMQNECGEHDVYYLSSGQSHYTIQQDMPVCNTDSYADGISSTLSHELFETITDPDLSTGWHNGGKEIGDLCQDPSHWMELPAYSFLGGTGRWYDIQPEWSNKDARCYPQYDEAMFIGPLLAPKR